MTAATSIRKWPSSVMEAAGEPMFAKGLSWPLSAVFAGVDENFGDGLKGRGPFFNIHLGSDNKVQGHEYIWKISQKGLLARGGSCIWGNSTSINYSLVKTNKNIQFPLCHIK